MEDMIVDLKVDLMVEGKGEGEKEWKAGKCGNCGERGEGMITSLMQERKWLMSLIISAISHFRSSPFNVEKKSSHWTEDNRSSLVMILPLLTSLVALRLIEAKHYLVETGNKSAKHQVDAVRHVLPIEAKEEYEWEILVLAFFLSISNSLETCPLKIGNPSKKRYFMVRLTKEWGGGVTPPCLTIGICENFGLF